MKTFFFRRFLVVLSLFPFVDCRSESSGGGAEDLVRRQLRENRIRIGYDSRARRMVQLCVLHQELGASKSNPVAFEETRVRTFLCAERMARGSVMRSLTHVVEMKAESVSFSEEDNAQLGTAATSEARSSFFPYGCRIESSYETVEDGILQTAVALSWNPDDEKGIRRALFSPPDAFDPLPEPRSPSPEWAAWAESQDFARMPGFRSFEDSEGVWRFVGIGMADIEGKSEVGRLAAMRLARQIAGANLAYALFGSVEASRHLRKRMAESEEDGESESEVEQMVAETMRKSAKVQMKDAEVYTTTVIHPLSGRKLFVSVVGIEPYDLAKMNLLGETGSEASRSGENPGRPEHPTRPEHSTEPDNPSRPEHPNRPDHSFRPEHPNRPDHSFRPASNRPEHPSRRPRPDEDDGDDGNDMEL